MNIGISKKYKNTLIKSRIVMTLIMICGVICSTVFLCMEQNKMYLESLEIMETSAQDDQNGLHLVFETPITLLTAFSSSPLLKGEINEMEVKERMMNLISSSSLDSIMVITEDNEIFHTDLCPLELLEDVKAVVETSNSRKIFYLPKDNMGYITIEVPYFINGEQGGSIIGFLKSSVFVELLNNYRFDKDDDVTFSIINQNGLVIAGDFENEILSPEYSYVDENTFDIVGEVTFEKIEENIKNKESVHLETIDKNNDKNMVYISPFEIEEFETMGWSIVENTPKNLIVEDLVNNIVYVICELLLILILLTIGFIYIKKSINKEILNDVIINNIPGGVHRCQLYDEIHVDILSEGLCKLTGYTRKEIHDDLKDNYCLLMAEEDRAMFEKAIGEMAIKEQSRILEYRIKRKDGHEFWVMDSITSMRGIDGKMRAYAVVIELDDAIEQNYRRLNQQMLDENNEESIDVLEPQEEKSIYIRTFGYFDVFVNGEAIHFKSAKAKEFLAVLVDRKGGYVTSTDMATYLYEDGAPVKTLLARCRKASMNLKSTLEEYGLEDLVEIENNARRINLNKCTCDYYKYLDGDLETKKSYHDEYMVNYSWAETTAANLSEMK